MVDITSHVVCLRIRYHDQADTLAVSAIRHGVVIVGLLRPVNCHIESMWRYCVAPSQKCGGETRLQVTIVVTDDEWYVDALWLRPYVNITTSGVVITCAHVVALSSGNKKALVDDVRMRHATLPGIVTRQHTFCRLCLAANNGRRVID